MIRNDACVPAFVPQLDFAVGAAFLLAVVALLRTNLDRVAAYRIVDRFAAAIHGQALVVFVRHAVLRTANLVPIVAEFALDLDGVTAFRSACGLSKSVLAAVVSEFDLTILASSKFPIIAALTSYPQLIPTCGITNRFTFAVNSIADVPFINLTSN